MKSWMDFSNFSYLRDPHVIPVGAVLLEPRSLLLLLLSSNSLSPGINMQYNSVSEPEVIGNATVDAVPRSHWHGLGGAGEPVTLLPTLWSLNKRNKREGQPRSALVKDEYLLGSDDRVEALKVPWDLLADSSRTRKRRNITDTAGFIGRRFAPRRTIREEKIRTRLGYDLEIWAISSSICGMWKERSKWLGNECLKLSDTCNIYTHRTHCSIPEMKCVKSPNTNIFLNK